MKNINWDDIIAEWSYRLPKGFPTMKNGKFTIKSELKVLQEVLAENGINEMPDLTKKAPTRMREAEAPAQAVEITKEQLIANLSDPNVVISLKTLTRINSLLSRSADFEEAIETKVREYLTVKDENKSQEIVDILYQDGNDQKKVSDYLRDRSVAATAFQGSPKKISEAFASTGLTGKALGNLATYKWSSTPRIGDLEVLLAILLKGGSRPGQGMSGDLAVDNKPCEVGGFNKRLTGQKGVNSSSVVHDAFRRNYVKFAEERGILVDFVSVSGGAKDEKNTLHYPTGNKNWAASQDSGWFISAGNMNKEFINITKDSDDPITKSEVANLLTECLKSGFVQETPRPWDWVEQCMNDDGTLQLKKFMLEFAVFYFDYYVSLESEERTWFFLTNATDSSSSTTAKEDFSLLAFPATGQGLRPHIFTNVGLTIPSYSTNAGPQGVAFALKLGKVAGAFTESADDNSNEYYLY